MKVIISIALLLGTIVAATAQQQVPLERLVAVVEQQRNNAMNLHAISEARLAEANEEIARLRKQIEELKPKESK